MFATATIVFREFLEVALVLTIVLAATRGLPSRMVMVAIGLLAGVIGSVIIAFFTDSISEAMDGVGQEIFNAVIMFIAVGFLSWTAIWMKRYGRDMSQHLRSVGADIVQGEKPVYTIIAIIALATFREGAEIVLFTYGMLASGQFALGAVMLGGMVGAIGGILVGVLLYFGLLRAAQKHLFTVTSWLLILLTAGIAAQGAGFLVAADVLPTIHPKLWDSSDWVSGGSFMGELLGVLVGYNPRPTGIELVFYGAVIVIVGGLYCFIPRRAISRESGKAEIR